MARAHLSERADSERYPSALPARETLLLRAFWSTSARLPVSVASAFGAELLRQLGPRLPKQRQVLENLARGFPDTDPERRSMLARAVWANLGRVLAEYPHLDTLIAGRTAVCVAPELSALLRSGRPMVFCGAHLGNWELAPGAIARVGVPMTVVAAPQRGAVDAQLTHYRRRSGVECVPRIGAARLLRRALARGCSVGLLTDQRADDGADVPFLGCAAPTSTTPARLALAAGAPLVPVRTLRLDDGTHRVELHPPLRAGRGLPRRERALALTQALARLHGAWIRSAPEQWLCTKRRWRGGTADRRTVPALGAERRAA